MARDEFMREVRNGIRSPEMLWRREEGMGLCGQVVGWPDITSTGFNLEREGRKRLRRRVVVCEWDQWSQ